MGGERGGVNPVDELLLVPQAPVKARRFTLAENVGDYIQDRCVRAGKSGYGVENSNFVIRKQR